MFTKFEDISPKARVWIYQSNRLLDESERAYLNKQLTAFTESWTAHGKDIKSSFDIFYDRFLVIAADEGYNTATGCSIDSSVEVIKKANADLSIDFFDRTKIAFLKDTEVQIVDMKEIPKEVESGKIRPDTVVFNNLVKDIKEFNYGWKIPARESWLNRFFHAEAK